MQPHDTTNEIPYGYCACGCGQKTTIPTHNDRRNHRVKGVPMQFLSGHHNRKPLHDRFWKKVDRSGGPDACWLWTGAKNASGGGYGMTSIDKRVIFSHRASYEMHFSPIPDGLWVLHKCDNSLCVNPDHLFLGTPKNNTEDMTQKGRDGGRFKPGHPNYKKSQQP